MKALTKIKLKKKPNQRKKPKPAQEEVAELEEDIAMSEQEKADQETPGNVEKVVDEMWKCGKQHGWPRH